MVSSLSLQWKSNMLEQADHPYAGAQCRGHHERSPASLQRTFVLSLIKIWSDTGQLSHIQTAVVYALIYQSVQLVSECFMCMYVSSRMQQTSYLVELQAHLSLPSWPLLCCPLLRSQPYLPPPSGVFQSVWRLMSSAPTLLRVWSLCLHQWRGGTDCQHYGPHARGWYAITHSHS